MIFITAIKLSGGSGHQHVSDVWWLNGETGVTNTITVAGMVKHIHKGNAVYVGGQQAPVPVGVWKADPPYLRTYADQTWTDNLLALPTF